MVKKIEYIENNKIYGIKYNYDLVRKEFTKMLKVCGAPKGLYNPCLLPLTDARYFGLLSERSSSKTTQLLLFCLTFWKLYGTTTAYIRQLTQQITRKMYKEVFKVINDPQWGYVSYITDGEYNELVVDVEKKVYFAFRNENGTIERQDTKYCMMLLAVEMSEIYTSSLNTLDTDLLIFDEFTRTPATGQDFVDFMQLIATIRRERRSLLIFLLSNTVTPYHQYLRELGVSSQLERMKRGHHAIITTPLGVRVYVELLDVAMHNTKEFKQTALEYFGFENEALRSIYGGEWEINGFRHIPRGVNPVFKHTNIKLEFMGNFISLQTFSEGKQYGVFLSPFTGKMQDKYIIISDQPKYAPRQLNGAYLPILRKLAEIDKTGHLYFSDNQTGLLYTSLYDYLVMGKKY